MKSTILFSCILLAGVQLSAQSDVPDTPVPTGVQHEQTVFNKSKLRGAWGGVEFNTSKIGGYTGYGSGGSLGLVFNSLSVGAYGLGEVYDGFLREDKNYAFTVGHGGLMLGYAFPTKKALHLTGSVKVGAGAVGLARKYHDWDYSFDENDIYDAIFVVTPEVGVELNLTHWMRLSATAGYRLVDGFQGIPELDKNDLNAPTFGLNFRFGWFGHKK